MVISFVEFSASWKCSSPGSGNHMEGVNSDQRLPCLNLGWLAADETVEVDTRKHPWLVKRNAVCLE